MFCIKNCSEENDMFELGVREKFFVRLLMPPMAFGELFGT